MIKNCTWTDASSQKQPFWAEDFQKLMYNSLNASDALIKKPVDWFGEMVEFSLKN